MNEKQQREIIDLVINTELNFIDKSEENDLIANNLKRNIVANLEKYFNENNN